GSRVQPWERKRPPVRRPGNADVVGGYRMRWRAGISMPADRRQHRRDGTMAATTPAARVWIKAASEAGNLRSCRCKEAIRRPPDTSRGALLAWFTKGGGADCIRSGGP